MPRINEIIEQLKLTPHPEGGFYASSFTGDQLATSDYPHYTSIYFLLREGDKSHFHQLISDELWYFHEGDALTIHMIEPDGTYRTEQLGLDLSKGERPQVLVKKGTIFGSTVNGKYGLVGCMVSPGFRFEDFKLFKKQELVEQFPEHQAIIKHLTMD
ncbi:cupin [Halolactibacillus miurensis]|uniref:Cupin n=1 Tax=Halolactibacillus miurensis TaxID=306541 RepID=A0A1I6UBE3_9BACI|nr:MULTISPECIES: cupin domain-containing protein [Halolactibacillus]GEM05660.1 cupin [Halolactibacillus miurensis]SFS98796.1 hypothetical protein SAMN05421668_12424 [Halolactibacillus miurensis]